MTPARRLQFNPEPLRVVKHRLGEGAQEHRCNFYDGRGRCTSYDTKLVKPLYLWLCAKHEAGVVLSDDWQNLAHHFFDQLVDLWHDAKDLHDEPLHEFVGLTWEQYAAWVEGRYGEVLP